MVYVVDISEEGGDEVVSGAFRFLVGQDARFCYWRNHKGYPTNYSLREESNGVIAHVKLLPMANIYISHAPTGV